VPAPSSTRSLACQKSGRPGIPGDETLTGCGWELGCGREALVVAELSRDVKATVAAARSALDEETYAKKYATGAAYSSEEARDALSAQVLRR
jgi:hypothetical protein